MTGRVLMVAFGAVAALIGLTLAAVAVVLLVITGRDGAFGGGESTLSTPRYALVSDAAGLGSGRVDATVRITVTATGGGPVFVGVAPAAAVEGYLSGVAYDELADVRLSPFRATLVPTDGAVAPVRPADRPVWTISATGPGERTIDVPVAAGGQRLVVMNADASEGVEVTAALSLRVPFLRSLAIGLLVAGAIVGKLSGIGTLGGIVATFATGFILVAAFRTATILLGTGVVVAFVGGLVLWYDRQRQGPRDGAGQGPLPGAALALLPVSILLVAVAPNPCQQETEYHCARVVADPDRPTGRTLELDTLRHSYVDLADPAYLEFEYTRAIAAVADSIRPATAPLQALHIGGGGFTMPRYLAATRPGTRSTVLEIDGGVVELGRERLGLNDIPGLTVRVGDGRTGLQEQPAGRFDLAVGDAFGGLAVPWHLTTRQVAEQVRDVLTDDGVYAVNVIDYQPDRFARAEIATLQAVFPHVILLGAPITVAGQGGGNHILVASRRPLPVSAIQAALATRGPWVAADEATTTSFAGGAEVLTDQHAPVDQLITQFSRTS